MKFYLALLAILIGTGFLSCKKNKGGDDVVEPGPVNDANQPAANADITVAPDGVVNSEIGIDSNQAERVIEIVPPKERNYFAFKKDLLNKEFLLQVNMTHYSPAPEFSGLKSRIVRFVRKLDQIFLMESLQGYSIDSESDNEVILASIPIVKEEDAVLELDFNKGMSKIFVAGDMYASDFYGKEFSSEDTWTTLNLAESFIKSITYNDSTNSFNIRQVGRAEAGDLKSGLNSGAPIEITYFFQVYVPNPEFIPINYYNKKYVGFFELTPQVRAGGGDSLILSSRFDAGEGKKIKFYISQNTPAEYLDAVKKGVLYWNRIFGRDVLEVEVHPKKKHEITEAINLIHWIDWKDATYAYADTRTDPRTGEIKNAQIFLTSSFAENNIRQARMLQKSLSSYQAPELNLSLTKDIQGSLDPVAMKSEFSEQWNKQFNPASGIFSPEKMSIKGMQINKICDLRLSATEQLQGIAMLSDSGSLNDKTQLLSQDIIATVVAHEVGHTLGLRHNFAGSLAAKFEFDEYKSIYKSFILERKIPEKLIGSTVMDYYTFKDMAMIGAQIRETEMALDYDKKAIGVLYNQVPLETNDRLLFCTDSHRKLYVDCNVFDSGPHLPWWLAEKERESIETLPYVLAEVYINALYPPKGYDPVPLHDILLSPDYFARRIVSSRHEFLTALSADAEYLKVRGKFAAIGDINESRISSEESEYLGMMLTSDWLKDHLKLYADGIGDELEAKFNKILDEEYKTFFASGSEQKFTESEKSTIKKNAAKFFELLPDGLQKYDLIVHTIPHKFRDLESIQTTLPELMTQKIKHVLTKVSGTTYEAKFNNDYKNTALPLYAFEFKYRALSTVGFSDQSVQGNALWGIDKFEDMTKEVYQTLNDHAFGKTEAHQLFGLRLLENSYQKWTNKDNQSVERKAQNWIVENQMILMRLKSQAKLY